MSNAPPPKMSIRDNDDEDDDDQWDDIVADMESAPAAGPPQTPVQRARQHWKVIRDHVSGIAGEGYRERGERNSLGELNIIDPDKPTEKEAWHVLDMIRNSEFFNTLPPKYKEAVMLEHERKAGKVHALDPLTTKEKGEDSSDEEGEYLHDRKKREKERDEHRLRYLWNQRSPFTNWRRLLLFHFVVILNFFICVHESYRILFEHAYFDKLFLSDEFNCLEAVESGDSVNHLFNIVHGFACVLVLFTDHLHNANLCWFYVTAQISHAMCDVFQFCYNVRIPLENKKDDDAGQIFLFVLFIAFEIISTAVVIQRYYDLSNILQKRSQRFTASIFTGRLLNETIIYKNESNFLQKKFTLRQATSLQISGILQKLQHYKDSGREANLTELNVDVKAAIAALKDVNDYDLTKLRKMNTKKIQELQSKLTKAND